MLCLAIAVPLAVAAVPALAQEASPVPVFDHEFALTSLAGTPVTADAGITVTFGSDGSLSGFGGCNAYSSTFESSNGMLTIAPIAATLKTCGDSVDQLEHQYLSLLQDAAGWSLNGSAVEITTNSGSLLVFGGETASSSAIGGSWTLQSIDGEAVSSDLGATAIFGDGGSLTGNGGCNTYTGTYTVDGSSLTVGPLAATLMFCEGTSDTEHAFLAALQDASSWAVDGSTLTITGSAELVLSSGAAPTGATPAGDWTLRTIDGDRSDGLGVSATFFDDGTVAGFGGCNQYHATWSVDGDALTVGPIGSTRKLCDDTSNALETTFLTALQAAASFSIEGSGLTVTSADGTVLAFDAVGGTPPTPGPTPSAAAPTPSAALPSGAATTGVVGSWQMTSYGGTQLPSGMLDITLTFAPDGTFSGNGGCDDYSGSWTLAGSKLAMRDFQGQTGGTCNTTASGLQQGWFALVPYLDTATVDATGNLTLLSSFATSTPFVFAPAS